MTNPLTPEQLRWVASFTGVAVGPPQEAGVAYLADGAADETAPAATSAGATPVSAPATAADLPKITVSPDSAVIDPSGYQDFTATADYGDGTTSILQSVQWSASDPAVTIDANGRATAHPATVTATITATDPETGAQGTATVKVAPPAVAPQKPPATPAAPEPSYLKTLKVARVSHPDHVSSVSGGGHLQLAAVGIFTDKHTQDMTAEVVWQSSNAAVTIRQDGLAATDQAPADATITATDPHSGISGSLNIEIPLADYAQVLVEIIVEAPSASIVGGGTLSLTATGRYADGSPRDLTGLVRWESSDAAISVDAKGHASAPPVTASATITATDPDTGIAGSIELSVAPPAGSGVLLSIAITPENAIIDAGGELVFHATGVFDAGPPRDVGGAVEWSSDNAAIAIDDKGKATAGPQSASATIAATDRLSGVSGSTTVTISPPQERRVDTPFGQFSYWLHAEPAVKPLLAEASAAYLTVEPMEDKANAAYTAFLNTAAKIPEHDAVLAEVQEFTDRSTSGDAAEAAGAKILMDSLKHDFEHLQVECENLKKDTEIDKNEIERVKDEQLRDEYKAKAAALDAQTDLIIDSVKNLVKAATGNVAGVIDQVALTLKGIAKLNNEWTQKAKDAAEAAAKIALDDVQKRYATALDRNEEIKKYIAAKESDLDEAKADTKGKWSKSEYWYDKTLDGNPKLKTKAKFRFYNLRPGIAAAKFAAGMADPAHDAIEIARVAAEKLLKFAKQPEYFMADAAEDRKIIDTWVASVRQMSATSGEHRDYANEMVHEYQQLFKDARDTMSKALGDGGKTGNLPKDDVE